MHARLTLSNGAVPAPESTAALAQLRTVAAFSDVVSSHNVHAKCECLNERGDQGQPQQDRAASHKLDDEGDDKHHEVGGDDSSDGRKTSLLRH